MSLRDFISAQMDTATEPLTMETLNRAMDMVRERGSTPRHDCRYDGHVAHFMSTRCVYCREEIRALTPDENHLRYGEFG